MSDTVHIIWLILLCLYANMVAFKFEEKKSILFILKIAFQMNSFTLSHAKEEQGSDHYQRI